MGIYGTLIWKGFTFKSIVLFMCVCASMVSAQSTKPTSTPVLIIDIERLITQSAFGTQANIELSAQWASLGYENNKIKEELRQEELDLTQKRPQMDPAKFRILADEFDQKSQRIRGQQDAKEQALNRKAEDLRRSYLQRIQPILEIIMTEKGASVIVDRRVVFLSLETIDITDIALEKIREGSVLKFNQ